MACLNPKAYILNPDMNMAGQQRNFTNATTLNPKPQHLSGTLWSSSRSSQTLNPKSETLNPKTFQEHCGAAAELHKARVLRSCLPRHQL